ncbi:MAG: hypothetical protein K6T30_04325 [Alicyclobacillus sp.]|nr:hypothetical protein [Alicyclobacillus sp.]
MVQAGMVRRARLVRLAARLVLAYRRQDRLWRQAVDSPFGAGKELHAGAARDPARRVASPAAFEAREVVLAEAGRAVREAAFQLCGVIVKAGQFLAMRRDILPEAFTRELEGLQDEVPPASFEAIRRTVEQALGKPVSEVFRSLDETPVASASLAQVHRATLYSGDAVAVKVLRPGIERMVQADLTTLRFILHAVRRVPGIRTYVNLEGLYEAFAETLAREIDLVQEARHMRLFMERYGNDPRVVVPAVYDSLSGRRVLVMSWVEGADLRDVERLREWGVNPAAVRDTLIQLYARQLLADGFVHLDPHFGNFKVLPDGRLAVLDHGMAMQLGKEEVQAFRGMIQSAMFGDRNGVLSALRTLGFVSDQADVRLFDELWLAFHTSKHSREALRDVIRGLLNHPSFQVQTRYMLLIRCIGILKAVLERLTGGEVRWTELLPERVAPVLRPDDPAVLTK